MPEVNLPQEISLSVAGRAFAQATSTESAEHIKPLHRYLALRLVIEGGFLPTDLKPRPPLAATPRGVKWHLTHDRNAGDDREQVVLGGLKSKRIDLVVSKNGIGPVLAISVKGTGKAFRNLVNRTEEAIGDCANIHIMYPGLVYGFAHVLQATQAGAGGHKPNDIALDRNGEAVPAIRAYANGLEGLAGRRLIRNEYARYEAVGFALIRPSFSQKESPLVSSFPLASSPIALEKFFPTLYQTYDLRYPLTYTDPSLRGLSRIEWSTDSAVLQALKRYKGYERLLGYRPRVV